RRRSPRGRRRLRSPAAGRRDRRRYWRRNRPPGSAPRPARRRARSARESPLARKMGLVSRRLLLQQGLALADIDRNAPQYSLEAVKRFADGEAAIIDAVFPNGRFMHSG